MSAETYPLQFESEAEPVPLQGAAVLDRYAQQADMILPPLEAEATTDYASADVVLPYNPTEGPIDAKVVRAEYAYNIAQKAYDGSWWRQALHTLKEDYAAEPDQIDNVELTAKHDFRVCVDGEPTNQGFEVYEVGEPADNQVVLEALQDSLTAIDQFSGGLMASDAQRQKIILANGIEFAKPSLGYAMTEEVVINVSALKDKAESEGADLHSLVSIIVTHELLGHGMEEITEGVGEYYDKHFDYSDEIIDGKHYPRVHATVVPKSDEHAGSQPVREYGKRNSAEDLASSVDATVSEAMGWGRGVEVLPRLASTPDAHRSDLAIQLMQQAADKAASDVAYWPQNYNKPGIVGSEILPVKNDQGEVVGYGPVRRLEMTTMSAEQAIDEEIARQITDLAPRNKIKVYLREDDISNLL